MGLAAPASFMEIIARCLNRQGCIAIALHNHHVAEIMSSPAITATPDIAGREIAALFADRNINRLPIVDNERRPLGIVSRSDLVNAYGDGLCPQGDCNGKVL
jgi:CBS domain-containing protein